MLQISHSKGGKDNDKTFLRGGSSDLLRIFYGQYAKPDRYNYFALTEKSQYKCGGALIADNVVLTAAHCAGTFFQVGIGKHSLYSTPSEYESVGVLEEIQHPNYTGRPAFDNDFMLVILEEKSSIDPVCIVDNSIILEVGETLTVMGFGRTETGDNPTELKEAEVQYITNENCSNIYDEEYLISENMMCALSGDGQDACQGDSGGPLIKTRDDDDKNDVLLGIVSWGVDCGIYPGVYSRVSSQLEWIKGVVELKGGTMCTQKIAASDFPSPYPIDTRTPSSQITSDPTSKPTATSAALPSTDNPTLLPTFPPTITSSGAPTSIPTSNPTLLPTFSPIRTSTGSPTSNPTLFPSFPPTVGLIMNVTSNLTPIISLTAGQTTYLIQKKVATNSPGYIVVNGVSVSCDTNFHYMQMRLYCRVDHFVEHCPDLCRRGAR